MNLKQKNHLRSLLNHLEGTNQQDNEFWKNWRIQPLTGGANNQLFRAKNPHDDYVIKFTIRDERNRATHEFQALTALEQKNLHIAPKPIFLDNDTYRQPVVVQTYLKGKTLDTPPKTDTEWHDLLQHYTQMHTITPNSNAQLSKAIAIANTATECCALAQQQLSQLPRRAQSIELRKLTRLASRFQMAKCRKPYRTPLARRYPRSKPGGLGRPIGFCRSLFF